MASASGDEGSFVRINRTVVAGAAALLVAALLGIWLVFNFVNAERERELQQWQIRLGIVADSRAGAVSDWLEQQFGTLNHLAENASLQLYLTELSLLRGNRDQMTDEFAQAQFLGNLLTATAERTGFETPGAGPEVAANVSRVGLAGLMLTDRRGAPLVATAGMPPLNDALRNFVTLGQQGERALLDLHQAPNGEPAIGFLAPVFAVQGDRQPSDVVGTVIGLRLAAPELFARLRQPGETLRSAESYLVRPTNGVLTYLSPLADGTPALKLSLARDTEGLAAAALLDRPGGFGIFRDYRGTEVLATARAIPGTDWLLVRKVDRMEALGAADRRLTVTLAILLLAIGVFAGILVAVWRHASALRAVEAAERFRQSTERYQALSHFLRVVTDGQPTAIVALDDEGRYTFANAQAGREVGMLPEDMLGKSMGSVIGAARARLLEAINARVLREGVPESECHELDGEAGQRIVKTDHIPLPGGGGETGVLLISEDITDLEEARRKRSRTLRELVQTCVAVVDSRDPYSAHHSARVAEVARAIAEGMRLSDVEVETCDISGALMNLGKVAVPQEVLTKTDRLTDDELALIRQSIQTSADLIAGVEFDGPVCETIRQIQERWDGQGRPKGLQGEEILQSARIVAVANAFVALVSTRAYRPGLSFERASEVLLDEAGKSFDRRPVMALLNDLDNLGGRERWAHFADPPRVVAA